MKLLSMSPAPAAHYTTYSRRVEDPVEKEARIRQHEPLLYEIAGAFGLWGTDAGELVNKAGAYAREHQSADCYPFRIWLSKIMVHSCTFRIGSRLFARVGSAAEQEMPLSFRAVYVLSRMGFTTSELSIILNTTPSTVMERYNHALAYLAKRRA